MLKDLAIQSIQNFQKDCLKLCENHYPTVHNRGMSEHHLGRAFARRMVSTLESFGYPSQFEPIETVAETDHPHHYRIACGAGTIWVMTHHLVSASYTCREKLLADIGEWQAEYGYCIQPNDLLILLSDHWISRSQRSRELLHWWMGELPDDINEYSGQGITLHQSESQLVSELDHCFQISPCYLRFGHPLVRSADQQLVRKYIQLYAILEWQK
ncbi:hypothetical protein CSW98_06035 [Vibrio sp. HA2012]|uniref:hypothetical protein n=1 Tax=Vibrio sp. HA2012 TaxID=1971595 RepID=UPI000C2B84E3|nr:hypothetical protein [Vibrio sp. HA2012]PJC87451.1 hypothetical protein CSW98_06035 [Vibrio sp. HA2012]